MPEVGHNEQTPEKQTLVDIENPPVPQLPVEARAATPATIASHGQTTNNENHGLIGLSPKDMARLDEVLKKKNEREISGGRRNFTKIQKVPAMLLSKDNYNKYFRPRVIGVGPFHFHDKTSITEEVKHNLAAKFIQLSGKSGECLLGEMKKNIDTLKERFAVEVINNKDWNDENLAWMLFLDGCSILQFSYSCFHSHDLKEFNFNNVQAALIQQDLLLLQNQIPFLALRLLINLSIKKDQLIGSISEFVIMNIRETFHHRVYSWILTSHLSLLRDSDSDDPIHLLDFMRSVVLQFTGGTGSDRNENNEAETNELVRWSFRNVQDLKMAGIKFKPSDFFSSRAIYFNPGWFFRGELELPPLTMDDSTARKLWNLAAYEMCPDYHGNNYGVISYISFLDSLIDNEQDVKDLRSAHVLRNRLCSDEEVARLFNMLGSYFVTVSDHTYLNVKKEIQKHCQRRFPTWMAQVYYDHFRSPWTILALLAAVIALILTVIQTWYSVYPKN